MAAWEPGPQSELSDDDVEALLRLLSHLQQRGKTILLDARAGSVAIIPCVDGSFAPAEEVYSLADDDRALFELLAPELKILDRERLRETCPSLIDLCDDITPLRAIEIFEQEVDSLGVAPDQVLRWLDNHRASLEEESTRSRVRALPIFPSTNGDWLPLTKLSLPSDFEDVLHVAQVVDRGKVSGHEDLLQLLGARELDALEYLERHVVAAAHAGDLSEGQAVSILEIVHRHRSRLENEPSLRRALALAPLVPTDQGMQAPAAVHLPNTALTLIDPEAPTAKIRSLASHLVETLVWLGVSRRPNDDILGTAVTRLAQRESTPDPAVVLAILDSLWHRSLSDEVPNALRGLRTSEWLPVEGGGKATPARVYAAFQRYLFDSQGPHLGLPRSDQQRLSGVLDWLGVPSTPTPQMIVAHLRHCARTGTLVNDEVFRVLGEIKEESLVHALRTEACVQVGPGEFIEPTFVYWIDPQLGAWARHLPQSHRRYQPFYDRVGVRESPSPQQLEQLLRRISRTSGNNRLPDEDQAVVHHCWELLEEQLSDAEGVLDTLGALKSALGPRGLLEKPQLLLFVDGRRLAERIELIKDNLIHRDRTTQRALSAAGVRAAEEVIFPDIDETVECTEATKLAEVLIKRLPALERLVEALRPEVPHFDLSILKDLRIDVMPRLQVTYVTRFVGREWVDAPRPTEAIYLPEQCRLATRSQEPTRSLARELALCIAPEADMSTIAPSILEILTAGNLTEAMSVLDEYGVRDLDDTSWRSAQSAAAAEVDPGASGAEERQDAPAQPADVASSDADEDEGGAGSATMRGAGHGGTREHTDYEAPAAGENDSAAPRRRSRRRSAPNTSRLASYVSFGESTRDAAAGDEAGERNSVDQVGVQRVLAYEATCGRFPEEQSHSNPGFDVLSRNAEGVVLRRIEIKSIGGPWTNYGVFLSPTQFEDARTYPDRYWLYVVEHAEDDDACEIHRIQNPAGKVTEYGFDCGWRALDEPEIPRDEAGRPTATSTRGLLNWGADSSRE